MLLVAERGQVVHQAAFGWASSLELQPDGSIAPVAQPRPMTADTIFDLASITKVASTTAAIMRLVDDGLLDLDTRLGAVLRCSPARRPPSPSAS